MNNRSDLRAAQRYAAAYDQLSSTTQEAVRRAEELAVAVQSLAGAHEELEATSVPLAQKQAAVRAALASYPLIGNFIGVLLAAKRYGLLERIVQEVNALADKRQGILRARVLSARPLTDIEKQRTQDVLSARYGQNVKANFQTDETVLGGLKIWCNGELLDGSLQGQLNRMQEELLK